MKFTKLAFAVAAVVASAAASAQTANVTVYGGIRTAMEVARYSGPAGSARIISQENISSRFGFRGSESLGGGMNAFFQLESGFNSDAGGGAIAGREAWVGLNGGFGEVKLGYGLTPYDDVLGWAHQQGANSWENRNNGVSGGAGFAKNGLFTNYTASGNCTSPAFDARYGNSVSYQTPTMGGVVVRTQYALIGEAVGAAKCSGWDTSVRFTQGPIRLGAAIALHKDFDGLGAVALPHDQQAARVYGSFDAGFVRLGATYETASFKPDVGSSLKYKYWELGAVAPMGSNTFGVQYSQRDKGLASCYTVSSAGGAFSINAACVGNWNNGGGKHLAVTHDYALSRRTMIRSYYADLKNETNVKIRAFAVGLWHSF
jgi:predicted porin